MGKETRSCWKKDPRGKGGEFFFFLPLRGRSLSLSLSLHYFAFFFVLRRFSFPEEEKDPPLPPPLFLSHARLFSSDPVRESSLPSPSGREKKERKREERPPATKLALLFPSRVSRSFPSLAKKLIASRRSVFLLVESKSRNHDQARLVSIGAI